MYYANYDENTGEILGFYTDEIHAEIPEPNIELTYEEWQQAISGSYRIIDGLLEEYTPPEPELTLDEQIEMTQREYQAELLEIRDLYQAAEIAGNVETVSELKNKYVLTVTLMKREIEYLRGEGEKLSMSLPETNYCPICGTVLTENTCSNCKWTKY